MRWGVTLLALLFICEQPRHVIALSVRVTTASTGSAPTTGDLIFEAYDRAGTACLLGQQAMPTLGQVETFTRGCPFSDGDMYRLQVTALSGNGWRPDFTEVDLGSGFVKWWTPVTRSLTSWVDISSSRPLIEAVNWYLAYVVTVKFFTGMWCIQKGGGYGKFRV